MSKFKDFYKRRKWNLFNLKIKKEVLTLLAVHGLNSIVCSFSGLFVITYFLRITENSIGIIAAYNALFNLIIAAVSFILGNQLKIRNKLIPFRCGIALYFLFLLLVSILQENSRDYIYQLAVLYGIATACYWLPYHLILFDVNSFYDRSGYFSYETIVGSFVGLVVPISAGKIISVLGYQPAMVMALSPGILAFILSFKITDNKASYSGTPVSLNSYVRKLKSTHGVDDVLSSYKGDFFQGLCYGGALETSKTLAIFLTFNSELVLGKMGTLLAFVSIISAFAISYLRKEDRYRYFNLLVGVAGTALFLATIILGANVSRQSVVTYSIVFSLAVPVLSILQTTLSYNSVDRAGLGEYRTEHFIMREFFLNAGRILSYIFLLCAVMLFESSINALRVLLVALSLFFLLISIYTRKFIKQG